MVQFILFIVCILSLTFMCNRKNSTSELYYTNYVVPIEDDFEDYDEPDDAWSSWSWAESDSESVSEDSSVSSDDDFYMNYYCELPDFEQEKDNDENIS